MADILIRGMEMPKGCAECKLNSDTICVLINGCIYDESNGSNRRPDCPLVELPEHGDLIDRDALETDARKRYCSDCDNYNGVKCRACWVDDMLGDVCDFASVIPANKEESE